MPDLDLDERLRSDLHSALGEGPRSPARWDDVQARLSPAVARRRRRVALAVAALAVVAIVTVSLVITGSEGERVKTGPVGPGPGGTSASTSTGSTTVATVKAASTHVVATVAVGSQVAMLARPDGLWYVDAAATSLVHVAPSGSVAGRVTWPSTYSHYGQYGGPVHLASGEGSIWILFWSTSTLLRVDPVGMSVTGRTRLGVVGSGLEVEDVAAGLGHVWVTVCCSQGPSQRLSRIDPVTMHVDAQVALPGQGESQRVVAGPQGIFVTGEQFATVVQVAPSGTRILRQIPVPGGAGPVALGAQVWVLGRWDSGSSTGTTLSTIDPSSGALHHVANLSIPAQELVATPSAVWVGGVTGTSGVVGPVFELWGGSSARVSGTAGAYSLTAVGNVLWYFQVGKVVEISR